MKAHRILFVIETLGPGGAEQALLSLAAELSSRGHACEVAALWPPYTLGAAFEERGITVRRLDVSHRWNVAQAVGRLTALSRRLGPTVLHGHLFFGGLYVALSRRLNQRPLRVVTFHNLGYDSYPALSAWRRARRRLDRWAMCHAVDHRIAVSAAVARHYAGSLGLEQVEVIPNGVDVRGLAGAPAASRAKVLAAYEIEDSAPLVVSAGRFRHEKGLGLLLRALALLNRSGHRFHLLLAGEGPLEKEIVASIRDLELHDRVTLLGRLEHEELMTIIRAADLMVLASTHEGSPVTVAEAMALGTTVLATDVGGLPEMIESGRTGVLVPPGQVEAFAGALGQLVSDDALRARLSRAAQARVAERQDVGIVAMRHEQAYDLPRG